MQCVDVERHDLFSYINLYSATLRYVVAGQFQIVFARRNHLHTDVAYLYDNYPHS